MGKLLVYVHIFIPHMVLNWNMARCNDIPSADPATDVERKNAYFHCVTASVVRVPGCRGPSSIPGATISCEVVDLERGPLSFVSTTEELVERKSSGSNLENREYGRRDPSRWPRDTLYQRIVGTIFAYKRRSPGRYSSKPIIVGLSSCNWKLFSRCWVLFVRPLFLRNPKTSIKSTAHHNQCSMVCFKLHVT
jgi:hypothetical protein